MGFGRSFVMSNIRVLNRITAATRLLPFLFQAFKEHGVSANQQQWNDAEDAEATINQPPVKRNLSNRACDQRQRNHSKTRDDPERHDPGVTYRIAVRTDEGYRNDDVREGQPVCSIGDERILRVRLAQAFTDDRNPMLESDIVRRRRGRIYSHDRTQDSKLCLQRKCRQSAEDDGNYEESE